MACNYLARRSDYVVYHAFGMVLYIFYREAAFKSKCRSFIPSLKRIYLMLMSNFLHLQTCAISALPIYFLLPRHFIFTQGFTDVQEICFPSSLVH